MYDTTTLSYVPISGPTNSQRLPDFLQLDLRVDKTIHTRLFNFGIFLEILNVTNNANTEGYQYNSNYTQSAPINGLPFYPNLGIRGEIRTRISTSRPFTIAASRWRVAQTISRRIGS